MASMSIFEHDSPAKWRMESCGNHTSGTGGWVTLRCGHDSVTLHYLNNGNLATALRAMLAQVEAHTEDPLDSIDPATCAGSDHDPDGSKAHKERVEARGPVSSPLDGDSARANARTVTNEEET